jgi:hypothetical protein
MIFPGNMQLVTSYLTKLLESSPQLQQVELCQAQLTGDFDLFSDALANHKAIQELHFWMLRTTPGVRLDPLINGLSRLKRAVLDWCEVVPESAASNWHVLASPTSTLESLVIGQVLFQYETVCRMTRALNSNHSLTVLGLCGCQLSNKAGIALGQMLHYNTRLDRFELSGNPELGDLACMAISTGLQNNTRLRRLDLSDNDAVTKHGYHVLIETLHSCNTTLECMSTDADRKQEESLNFYLRLNRSGRRKILLQDPGDQKAWIDTLALQCGVDLDYTCYYLSTNPNLCNK